MRDSIWTVLGIAPTNDATEVRRAYARRLKEVHPEDDPEGFQALRQAYDQAARMAQNGWAVPPPAPDPDDDFDDEDDAYWPDLPSRAWTSAGARPDPSGSPLPTAEPVAPSSDVPDDIRAELARERELTASHKALCDQLTTLVSDPDGDPQNALSAMLAIFRSPGMDSLETHVRTEHWLAWVVTEGGPVVDYMVEPLIEFFRWNDSPVGVDLRHAYPVLQRRDAAATLRRLENGLDPDHLAWRALCDKPTPWSRLRERFNLGLQKSVFALLDRIDLDLPQLSRRMNAEAVSRWRRRRQHPVLPASFLWTLLCLPPLSGLIGVASGVFGPPAWSTFIALLVFSVSALFGAGAIWLHGVVRLRLRWRDEDWAWRAPLWVRLGWAPIAAVLLLVSALLPITLPWVAAYWLLLGPLLIWTKVTNGHLSESHSGLRTGFFMAAIPLVWLAVHSHGPQWVSLCWAATGVTLIAHHGRQALENAWIDLSALRRQLLATGLAVATVAAAAALAVVPILTPEWPLRAVAAAAVTLLVLISRPIRFTQSPEANKLWFNWMRLGWIPCAIGVSFAPFHVAASATFVGAGLWLAGGALFTFIWEAARRLEALFSRRRSR